MERIEIGPRPARQWSTWVGAKAGFRRTAYVAGPIAMAIASLFLAPTAIGLGAGRGWALPSLDFLFTLYVAAVFFGISEVCGGSFGMMVGLFWNPSQRAEPSRFRFGLWIWLLGLPVVLTLVASFGAGIYAGRVVERRLLDAIAAADRDDPTWRADDLKAAREPVPDAENSARVVAESLALLPENWPDGPKPPPGKPLQPDGELSLAYVRMNGTPANVRLDPAVADTIRRELESRSEAVRIARTVADFDRGRHELNYHPNYIGTLLPETQASRCAARLMQADAAIRAEDGDLDGAVDSCRAVLGVGRSIGDEPFLISQVVRMAEGQVAMTSLCRVLGQGEPSDKAMEAAQSLIMDELAQPLIVHGIRGERALLVEVIQRIGAGEVPAEALADDRAVDPDAPRPTVTSWGKLMFDHQQGVALDWMNQLVAIARRPYLERRPMLATWEAEMARVNRIPGARQTTTIPLLMTPSPGAFTTTDPRYQATLGATAILLAAERHRRKTGDWPVSIASIDPGVLTDPPLDPYTGQPFLVERRNGQFFVYSVGPNLRDEHGAYDPRRSRTGDPDDYGGSAWEVPMRRIPPEPGASP